MRILLLFILAIGGLAAFTRLQPHTQLNLSSIPPESLTIMALVGLLLLAELAKAKPKKKKED